MKYALVIGNGEYEDASLAKLCSPSSDTQALSDILKDKTIGEFDEVISLVNPTEANLRRSISSFFSGKTSDDLLLLYFSGHGLLDERGRLYLAVTDTQREILSATAVSAGFITDVMDGCRSKRQVLILDCCYSGAFARGSMKGSAQAITEATFEGAGYGRVVLTASGSTQLAQEGDEGVAGGEYSLFTRYLINGLKTGEADTDGDGKVALDEWYDYAYEQVLNKSPNQTPSKWSYNQQGDLFIARNPKPRPVQTVELPAELREAIESPYSGIRSGAVVELDRLLYSQTPEMHRVAKTALEKLKTDDSRNVSNAAKQALAKYEASQNPVPRSAQTAPAKPPERPSTVELPRPKTVTEAVKPTAHKIESLPPREPAALMTKVKRLAPVMVTVIVVLAGLIYFFSSKAPGAVPPATPAAAATDIPAPAVALADTPSPQPTLTLTPEPTLTSMPTLDLTPAKPVVVLDPIGFVEDYYEQLSKHECLRAWSMLDERYQQKLEKNIDSYTTWCETFIKTEFRCSKFLSADSQKASVVLRINYVTTTSSGWLAPPIQYDLLRDQATNEWKIDKTTELNNDQCSN